MSKKERTHSLPASAGQFHRGVIERSQSVSSKALALDLDVAEVTVSKIYDLERGLRLDQVDTMARHHALRIVDEEVFRALLRLARYGAEAARQNDTKAGDVKAALVTLEIFSAQQQLAQLQRGESVTLDAPVMLRAQQATELLGRPHYRAGDEEGGICWAALEGML
ncbi:hypothetical protein [Chitinilyticum litopenaei]|uniref:hypothetical protein n=1 Tax=Chitinilyticum litopenaei TaxID=1121276 RepID=UPI0004208C8F|nr:hypothetical protein [Chitinilyticum litopenaei]